jgi:PST family polysaccharide transporter
MATMTFAPYVINLFYSSEFFLAVDVLRWQILGILLRVVTWPMGFILLAKGNGKLFFWTELFANCVHLGLVWFGIQYFGLPGTGMAFFGMYVFYGFLVYWNVRIHYDFTLSFKSIRILSIIATTTGMGFIGPNYLPEQACLIVNVCITVGIGLYSIKSLIDMTGTEIIQNLLRKVKVSLRDIKSHL